jgi:hypothetical protein
MRKQLIMILALSAVAFTACGKKDSYKAGKVIREQAQPSPADNNEVADTQVEEKAEQNILTDEHHLMYRYSTLSEMMKKEIIGVSAQITKTEDKASIEVSVLDSRTEDCQEKSFKKEDISIKNLKDFSVINNLGRFRCIEQSCENILLLVETRRSVENEEFGGRSVLNGTVAVLLKKDESGIYKPTTTDSKDFIQVNNTELAVQSCKEIASRPKTGDEFALQREREKQEKSRQEELAGRPTTGDEFALQREREKQDMRLKQIASRVKAISERISAIQSDSIGQMTSERSDELKRLGTEQSKLETERGTILSGRVQKAVETQEESDQVDPELEQTPVEP